MGIIELLIFFVLIWLAFSLLQFIWPLLILAFAYILIKRVIKSNRQPQQPHYQETYQEPKSNNPDVIDVTVETREVDHD